MNKVCSKLRFRTTSDPLGVLLCIYLTKDVASYVDVEVLTDNWAAISNIPEISGGAKQPPVLYSKNILKLLLVNKTCACIFG